MRLVASAIVSLVTSAISLIIAAVILDDFSVKTLTFVVLVVVFAVILTITRAAVRAVIGERGGILSNLVGLIGAFVALLVTDVLADGLTIEGFTTWVIATLVVWGGIAVSDLLLGAWLFRRIAGQDRRPAADRR